MKPKNVSRAAILFFLVTLTTVSATPLTGAAVPGDIYVSDSPLLVKVSADGTQTILPFTVTNPSGVVFDQSGNAYIADTTTNSVIKVTPDGTQTTLATGLNDPQDLALDSSGNLFVANSGANNVVKIAPDGTQTTVATGLDNPTGLAFDATGNLFVSNTGSNAIVKVAPNGTQSNFVTAGLDAPGGLAFDANGNLLVADTGGNAILKVAPDGTVSTAVGTGLDSPADVSVDALGNLLVSDTGSDSIVKVAPDGTITPVTTGLISPKFFAMAPGLHQLLDISTRGFVETGNHVLIGGFIVRGTPDADIGQTTVVVRATGPSLDPSAVPDPLLDPVLELHDGSGALIATNDNWKQDQQAQIEATGLAPTDDRESAIEATLADGNYTAIVRGKNDTTGVALVEVYKIQ
ncbi:MAG TPA: SMP-30/gluconolactonase/LRE family protein [Chthoniobacterales bacterium]|jgi:sugar lactone lactonase YvrE